MEVSTAEKDNKGIRGSIKSTLQRIRQISEDWVYLALLGTIMSLLALFMDFITEYMTKFQQWVYDEADQIEIGFWRILATYAWWTMYVIVVILFAVLLTRVIAPQAIGSGIPEIKTIFRGVILKEYLTIRTMIAKFIGLTLTIGAGLPLGKEGPLVHMSSIVASHLSRLVHTYQGIYENESRSTEMLAAACAVGVAVTFTAPIGGVLFSIEVTSVYFAVRNYYRGFFAAAFAATITRIVTTLTKDPNLDFNAQYQTQFPTGHAYTLQEFPIFALIGFVLGIVAAAYIATHRNIVLFLRRNSMTKVLVQKYWMIYAILIPFIFGTITYPNSIGQFMAGRKKFTSTIPDLFSACTWSNTTYGLTCSESVTDSWTGVDNENSIFISLVVFQFVFFFLSIICSTLPVPAGMFIAVFGIGAAFGRTIGEIVAICLEGHIESGGKMQMLYPGVYAVVGAAALSGAVTHSVSVCVIVFEVTGQIMASLPIIIAVVIAVAVCSYLQPSIYDSVIRMKNLPFLPDIRHTASIFHTITVDRIMVTPVQCIPRDCSYRHVRNALQTMPKLRAFPVVDSTTSMVLLGSVNRYKLLQMLQDQKAVTTTKRREEARRRMGAALFGLATLATRVKDEDEKEEEKSLESSSQQSHENENVQKNRDEEQQKNNHHELPRQSSVTFDLNTRGSTKSDESEPETSKYAQVRTAVGGFFRSLAQRRSISEEAPALFDLIGDERFAWEEAILDETIDFSSVLIDSTPFQIVSHSSVFKVHSLFSLLGLNRAYVTEGGKLVGVVALKEIRDAIEKVQSGHLLPKGLSVKRKSEDVERGDTQDAHDNHAYDSRDDDDYLQDGLEIVPPLDESLLASDHLHLQMMKKRESVASILSTMSNERERWRMEQMTSRRSSKDILLRMNELYKDSESVDTAEDEREMGQEPPEIHDVPRIEVNGVSVDAGALGTSNFVALQIDDEERKLTIERGRQRHLKL